MSYLSNKAAVASMASKMVSGELVIMTVGCDGVDGVFGPFGDEAGAREMLLSLGRNSNIAAAVIVHRSAVVGKAIQDRGIISTATV